MIQDNEDTYVAALDLGYGPRKSMKKRLKNHWDSGAFPSGGQKVKFGAFVLLQTSHAVI